MAKKPTHTHTKGHQCASCGTFVTVKFADGIPLPSGLVRIVIPETLILHNYCPSADEYTPTLGEVRDD